MNSFYTRDDTLAALEQHPELESDVPADFVQNKEPKITVEDRFPIEWPDDPDLEWCPPGHGDVYTALQTSGTLEALLDARLRVRVPLQLRQPRRGARPARADLVRGRGAAVRDGGVREDARRPQGRPPGGAQGDRPAGAARDRADARGGPRALRRHRHLEVLQHQQPVGQPAGAGQGARRERRRARAADDRQQEDGRPGRQVDARGVPARDRDGRGGRRLRGRADAGGAAHGGSRR